jgi:hypothetical protein
MAAGLPSLLDLRCLEYMLESLWIAKIEPLQLQETISLLDDGNEFIELPFFSLAARKCA